MAEVRIIEHPMAQRALTRLRDASTKPTQFRGLARRLGAFLTIEATRELEVEVIRVDTPLGPAEGVRTTARVVAVPVLRAGLGLLAGVHDVIPTAAVGMVGLERDPDTLEARNYYVNVPDVSGAVVLVLEPMLATGGSAAAAVERVMPAASVAVLSVVATREAIERVSLVRDDARIVTAAVDPGLNDLGYIIPGLGDFGDRLWATPHQPTPIV